MHKLAFALTLLLTGCSGPKFSLRPEPGPSEFRQGREFRSQEVKGVKVAVALEEYRGGEAAFRVSVENGASAKLDVRPSVIGCFTNAGPGAVADPEQRLAELRAREAALGPSGAESTARLLNDTSSLLSSISDGDEARRRRAEAEASEARYREQDRERDNERARLATEKKYWADQALRRTTLAHGESVAGEIVCVTPEGDFRDLIVRMTLPGGNADFRFQRVQVE